jgi:hypothetical protein
MRNLSFAVVLLSLFVTALVQPVFTQQAALTPPMARSIRGG